jgi:hypothetical protein
MDYIFQKFVEHYTKSTKNTFLSYRDDWDNVLIAYLNEDKDQENIRVTWKTLFFFADEFYSNTDNLY